MPKTKTQCDAILDFMQKNGFITQKEAINELYIYRLASRICDLKKAGYGIKTEFVQVNTPYGHTHIARYSLEA